MLRGYIKEFKNGNLSIKFSSEDIERLKAGEHAYIILNDLLDNIDCYYVSEEFCLSNFDCGIYVYNCHTNLIYILAFSDIERLKAGERIKLYGSIPDDEQNNIINLYFN